jgi:hypothetical protein
VGRFAGVFSTVGYSHLCGFAVEKAKRSEMRSVGENCQPLEKSLRDSTFDREFGSTGSREFFMRARNLFRLRALRR